MDSSSCRVLVVDDSLIYHKLVEQVLEAGMYSASFANCGEEALDMFDRDSPSIVITDWMMPDFSGLELCKRIRASQSGRYTLHHYPDGDDHQGKCTCWS
jgi:CheY-like chemotaxis protein